MKQGKRKLNYTLILFLIIILGASLRLYQLEKNNLWFDEAAGICNAMNFFNFPTLPVYNYRPVYIFLLNRWIALFGISALATRSLFVLLGTGSILIIYQLGKQLFNSEIGLISAFMLSVSCFGVFHSRQVRTDTLLLFITLMSLFSFVKFFIHKRYSYLIFNLFLNILLIYTHPYGFSIILTQLLYIITSIKHLEKPFFKKILIPQILLLAILGVFFYSKIMLQQNYFKSIHWWARSPSIIKIFEAFQTFSYGGSKYGLESVSIRTCPPVVAAIATILFLVLFCRGLLAIKSIPNNKIPEVMNLVILWLIFPVFLAFILSYVYFPVFLIRPLIICAPAFYFIIASGISLGNKFFLKIIMLFVIFILNFISINIMYNTNGLVDWGKTVSLMKQRGIEDNAVIIVCIQEEIVPFMYYFSGKDKEALKNLSLMGKFENNKWHDSFDYEGYRIIGVADEFSKEKKLTYSFKSSPEHNIYSCEYMVRELDKKILQKYILTTDRQIWLLLSDWTTVGNECIAGMIISLKEWFEIEAVGEVGGVKVFLLKARNRR